MPQLREPRIFLRCTAPTAFSNRGLEVTQCTDHSGSVSFIRMQSGASWTKLFPFLRRLSELTIIHLDHLTNGHLGRPLTFDNSESSSHKHMRGFPVTEVNTEGYDNHWANS